MRPKEHRPSGVEVVLILSNELNKGVYIKDPPNEKEERVFTVIKYLN